MISLLMSSGADVTIYDKTGQSPLEMAELNGKKRITRLLRKDRHLS
jgi:ankyrin repeat protein